MPRAQNELVIERSAGEVFAFLADAENDPRWRSGVLELRHVGGSGVGARYRQVVAGPGGRRIDADIEIPEFEPPRLIAFRTTTGPVRPSGRYDLAAAGGGTRVRFELAAELRGLKKLMRPIVQRTMAREVGGLGELKRVLEEAPGAPSRRDAGDGAGPW